MKISHCSSLDCHNYNCDYCNSCSHAIYDGQGTDKTGKLWRWEDNPYFGPLFLRKDGEPLANQPARYNHPASDAFYGWK
jgi:hypothetical protein